MHPIWLNFLPVKLGLAIFFYSENFVKIKWRLLTINDPTLRICRNLVYYFLSLNIRQIIHCLGANKYVEKIKKIKFYKSGLASCPADQGQQLTVTVQLTVTSKKFPKHIIFILLLTNPQTVTKIFTMHSAHPKFKEI